MFVCFHPRPRRRPSIASVCTKPCVEIRTTAGFGSRDTASEALDRGGERDLCEHRRPEGHVEGVDDE
eukprot:11524368-Heterocapsa_arctica.AAC.1